MLAQIACGFHDRYVLSRTLSSSLPKVCPLHDFGVAIYQSTLLFIVLSLSSSSLCGSYSGRHRHHLY